MKIKALIYQEANKFEISELTLDEMKDEDIKVKTIISAISPGTERWVLKGKHIGTKFPCVPGYHRIGIIEKVGKNVKNFKEGDIVYGIDNRWKENIYRMWGAHVSHSVGNWKNYWFISSKIPDNFELETIVFTQLSAVATRGIKALEVKSREKIAIIGAGFLGLCACQLSIYRNAVPILIDKDPERVEFGKKFTQFSFLIDDKEIDEKLKEIAPEGFDHLYDTVGDPNTTDKLVQITKFRGKILLQAQYFDKEKCAIDLDQIKIREITIKTTIGIDTIDFYETLDYIKKRILKISEMITHRFTSEELTKGFEILRDGKPFNLGILFWWK
ncbi:MAG TPA: zinc-binding dehydrogenase [bacterium]|nr:zinc-binding dehydrogenase [bacterium]HOM26199.1 zinc-binding dehydrogenase [bacterium]